MEIIAHRGAHSTAPENSLSAIEKALSMNVPCIEIDCRLSHDNKVVVFHDDTLKRMTQKCILRLDRLIYKELSGYDIGEGQHIPLLSEVLDRMQGKTRLIIEAKSKGSAAEIVKLVKGLSWVDRVEITSSLMNELQIAKKEIPSMPITAVIDGALGQIEYYTAQAPVNGFSVSRALAKLEWVRQAKAKNYIVRIYTVNSAQEAEEYAAWGVDGIFTDYPEIFFPPDKN